MSLWVQPTLKGRELERCEHQAGGIIGPHLRGCLLLTRTCVVKNEELYPRRIWVNLCPSSISAEREPLNLGMSWVTATYSLFMVGPWLVAQDGDRLWERPGLRLEGWGFEPRNSNRAFREGRGPIGWGPLNHKVEDSTSHACIMKPQQNLGALKLGELPGLAIFHAYCHTPSTGVGSPSLRMLKICTLGAPVSDSALCVSSFGWFQLASLCYDKTLITSIVLSWVLWAVLANYQIRGSPRRPPSL